MSDLRRYVFASDFTNILHFAYSNCNNGQNQLDITNLPTLPTDLSASKSSSFLNIKHFKKTKEDVIQDSNETSTLRPLLSIMIDKYGVDLIKTGFLKLISCGISFASPLLLGRIVSFLESDSDMSKINILYGFGLVALLILCSVFSAIINTNFNIRSWVIKAKLIGAFSPLIFARTLTLPLFAWSELGISDAQVNNLIQIDVEQLSGCLNSIHDLWSLPLQIIITFVLLYVQIRFAFLAGVAVILLMLPVNSVRFLSL